MNKPNKSYVYEIWSADEHGVIIGLNLINECCHVYLEFYIVYVVSVMGIGMLIWSLILMINVLSQRELK